MLHLLLAGSLLVLGQNRTQPREVVQIDLQLVESRQPATELTPPAPTSAMSPAPKPSPVQPAKPLRKPQFKPDPASSNPAQQPNPEPPPAPVTAVAPVLEPMTGPPIPEVKQLPSPASSPPPTSGAAAKPEAEPPPPASAEPDRSARFNAIRDRVMAALRYPLMARRQGWSGAVKVEFTILPTGEIRSLRVVQSSGYSVLDKQALRAVEAAAPFPTPSTAATITLPVNFQLD